MGRADRFEPQCHGERTRIRMTQRAIAEIRRTTQARTHLLRRLDTGVRGLDRRLQGRRSLLTARNGGVHGVGGGDQCVEHGAVAGLATAQRLHAFDGGAESGGPGRGGIRLVALSEMTGPAYDEGRIQRARRTTELTTQDGRDRVQGSGGVACIELAKRGIDRTRTAMGGRLLRQWLRYPLCDLEHIAARQAAIAALLESPTVLKSVIERLDDVCDIERIVGRVAVGRASPRDFSSLRKCLESLPELIDLIEHVSP